MFKTIVVGVDGSRNAEKALNVAIDIARFHGSRVFIVHVTPSFTIGQQPPSLSDPVLATLKKEAEEVLGRASQMARSHGIPATTKLAVGDATEEIMKIAQHEEADLIVVGNRGLSPVKGFLLGSVSGRLSQHAECSVLIVK